MRIVFIGPPGAGKGTQAAKLAMRLGIPHLSTGEILRDAVGSGSELGRLVGPIMAEGKLVSDDLIVGVVRDRVQQRDCRAGFLLDGFPRTVAQAEAFDHWLADEGKRVTVVLEMFVPRDELIRRLHDRYGKIANPRPDDHPEAIPRRIQTYLDETRPVVNYYDSQGLLRRIDGVGAVSEVFERILQAIDSAVLTPPRS